MTLHGYQIIIEPDEGNTFHGYVPAVPACHTWGETKQETIVNVKEALELCIEDSVESHNKLTKVA